MRLLLLASLFTVTVFPGPVAQSLPPELPLPDARHGHRVEAVDGGLLAFGGFATAHGRTSPKRHTFWLGPDAKAWQRRADLNTGRAFFASAVVDGVVYAVGDGVERYDFANDRWREVAPAGPLPHSHFGAAAIGREIFVLGGFPVERSGFSIVDVDTGAVRAEKPPPGFRPGDHFHFVFALDGELHVVGGLDGDSFAPQREHRVLGAEGWRTLPSPPDGLWAKFGGGVAHDGALHLFGEFGGHRYAPGTGWKRRKGWDGMVALPALVALGSEIRALGGLPVGERRRPMLRIYDRARDNWRAIDE